jgi:hypothetical protein
MSEKTMASNAATEKTEASVAATEKTMASQDRTEKVVGYMKGVDTTAPVISNISAPVIYRAAATFDWDTDEPAQCQMKYGTDSSVESSWTAGAKHAHFVTGNRSYGISGLTQGTPYYFRVYGTDSEGNVGSSAMYVFTTASLYGGGSQPQVV